MAITTKSYYYNIMSYSICIVTINIIAKLSTISVVIAIARLQLLEYQKYSHTSLYLKQVIAQAAVHGDQQRIGLVVAPEQCSAYEHQIHHLSDQWTSL